MLKLSAIRAKDAGKEIGPQNILETLSQLSGLPVSILDTRERLHLKSVRDFFSARVIGQEEAVEAIVDRIAMLKAGLADSNRPVGVFLFVGPTGTGGAELAKVLDDLFSLRLTRPNDAPRHEPASNPKIQSVSKLIGDPVGLPNSDSLVERVRKQPFSSVILLDEFEKAHPNIWDLFLQIFDDGRLSDANGKTADFRHTIIILTSNLGATEHKSAALGFPFRTTDLPIAITIMQAVGAGVKDYQARIRQSARSHRRGVQAFVARTHARDPAQGICS